MALVREVIPYLMSDYDGTIARTGEIPAGGVDVNGAYQQAVANRIDDDAAQAFTDGGGHLHRAPIEIVASLLPGISRTHLELLASKITNDKLDILLAQIGTLNQDGSKWPRPVDGFVEFWSTLSDERRRDIGTAIISAGHTSFIGRWFEEFNLEQPDAIVSAEVIDNLSLQVDLRHRVKPGPLPVEIAKAALSVKYGTDSINPIYYIGDSEEKDGGLAYNTGADFILVNETDGRPAWQALARKLQLSGYKEGEVL